MKKFIYLLTFAFLFVIEHSFSQCHAGFTWDQIGGSYIVAFTNTSTSEHDIISYHWNFGDGTEGDGQNPEHNFEEPGIYNVCLIIMDNFGCAADVCHLVTVEAINSECNAAFTWEQGDNLVIHFINQSTSQFDIISYNWNFGDGHEGDGQNPIHEYAEPGTYNVCLIIEDGQGCVSDVCHEVVVEAISSECDAEFVWEPIGGTYTIEFLSTSTSSHEIISYHWIFGDGHEGDGNSTNHTYEEPGTYNVCLIIENEAGCVADVCHEIVVHAINTECHAGFAWDQIGNTLEIEFINQSTSEHDIVSFHWDFGDGHEGDGSDPHHIYDHPGTYEVCLTIENELGCVDETCHAVIVEGTGDGCHAAFSWDVGDNGLVVHFFSQSTSEHDIISYHWNFGDGHEGDGQNPSHEYAEPGVYLVCLIITDGAGCVSDVCHEVVVEGNSGDCEAGFVWEAGQDNSLNIHFDDTSDDDPDIVSWHWTFGDGHSSDDQNPSHLYDEPGVYLVCLIVTNEFGCVADVCHEIHVEDGSNECSASFVWEHGLGTTIHFVSTSDDDPDIISWHWNFGDGHTSDDENPVHHYDSAGVYVVCLIVTNEFGCVADVCHEVHVEFNVGDCHASFVWDQIEGTYGIHFINTSDDDPDNVSWQWNFGDGHTSYDEHPTHEYDTSGVYLVCLIVTNEFGCVSDVCHEVHVYENTEGCDASFTWEQIDGHEAIHFNGMSESQNDIISYHWNFGDGHEGDGQAPNHEYEPGVYVVCLTITDNTGCVSDICQEVVVEEIEAECHAAFDWEFLHDGLTVRFHSLSTSEHDIVTYYWDFGDGHIGDNVWNPLHEYDAPGVYVVCLTITDGAGCTSTICHEVHIEGDDECHASFEFENIEDVYHFFNNSTGTTDHTTYLWEFGDGTSSTEENPEHEYEEDGTYVVCLFITDTTIGCESHFCHEIHFEAMFQEFDVSELKFYPPISATPTGFTGGDTEIFLKRYTNPVSETLHLEYTVNGTGEIIIGLYDVMGLQVKNISGVYIQRGKHESYLDVSDVYPGIYVLTIQFGDKVNTRSVVITK